MYNVGRRHSHNLWGTPPRKPRTPVTPRTAVTVSLPTLPTLCFPSCSQGPRTHRRPRRTELTTQAPAVSARLTLPRSRANSGAWHRPRVCGRVGQPPPRPPPPSAPPQGGPWEPSPRGQDAAGPPGGLELAPRSPTARERLTRGESGTWEVNSLIKTAQNPNFAEWQFGGKKAQQWENVGYAALDMQFSGDQL